MSKELISAYKAIREFFFPILEGEAIHYEQLTADEISTRIGTDVSNRSDRLIELSKDIYNREEDRRSNVESKANTLLSATGLTIALIANFGKSLFFDADNLGKYDQFTVYIFTLFFTLTIIYFMVSIVYAIKTLTRRGYHSLYPKDILDMTASADDYDKRIASLILEKTIKNYVVVNEKVDSMMMSQEYFKRGIVSIVIVTLILSSKLFLNYLTKYLNLL